MKRRISLSVYGWDDWTIGPYGKSRQWRLISPTGETYTPGEVEAIRGMVLDNDYLHARISALSGALSHPAMSRRLDRLNALAAVLGGLAGILSEPAALLGDPVNIGGPSKRRLPYLRGNLALSDKLIEELRAAGIIDVPELPPG